MALIAALAGLGWNYWRNQPKPLAVAPPATPEVTATFTPAPTATPAPPPSATPSPIASPTPIIHEVQAGETIIFIASNYGTSSEAIMEANGLDESSARLLRVGQQLLIPSTGPVGGRMPGATPQPPQVIHKVQSGETLSSIADQYDTSVEAILAINNLSSPDLIYEGQQLIVPLMPPTATPTFTPTPTPSSTPSPPYPAPQLLSPADGTLFEGEDAVILLAWASVGILRDNQVYLVELETPDRTAPATFTTQATSWRVPADLRPTGQGAILTWQVTVVQRLNPASAEPPEWKPLSPPTETRRFEWR
jgi:LysM repeat protein